MILKILIKNTFEPTVKISFCSNLGKGISDFPHFLPAEIVIQMLEPVQCQYLTNTGGEEML